MRTATDKEAISVDGKPMTNKKSSMGMRSRKTAGGDIKMPSDVKIKYEKTTS